MNIIDSIKEYLQKKMLLKYAYRGKTGFIPLHEIKSVAVVVDVTGAEFEELRKEIMFYFRSLSKKIDIYFLDLRKIDSTELLLTSIQTTILKKDVNWFGMPDLKKLAFITSNKPDLFISMIPGENFTVKFICACAPARFKIGISQYENDPFDMVLSGSESPVRCFGLVKEWLEKFV